MKAPHSRVAGFTLIEVMIAVAIVGILAAIAIPEYQKYTMRAKQAEALTITSMMKNAEFAHFALYDCFVPLEATPTTMMLGPQRQLWDSMASGNANLPCGNPAQRSFEDAAIKPNHPNVYYEYECAVQYASPGTTDEFTCSAYGDIDGDANFFELLYGTDHDGDGVTIPGPMGTPSFFPNDPIRISVGIY